MMGWVVLPARAAPRGVQAPADPSEGLRHRLQGPAASSWEGHGMQSRREAAIGSVGGLREGPAARDF